MKYLFTCCLFLSIIFSCQLKNKANPEELKVEKESTFNPEDYGRLLSSIKILRNPTSEEVKDFGSEAVLGIPIENMENYINQVLDLNEVVVKDKKVNLVIDYPLNKPAIFQLFNTNGFTKKDLLLSIYQKYKEIYKIEEETATVKTIPMESREGLSNRNETNGKYGIWGHDLIDLYLTDIEVYKDNKGFINLILYVES